MNCTALANQINTELIVARCCDALEPCTTCRNQRTEYVAIRHAARMDAVESVPTVPAPRQPSGLRARLALVAR
jgi:hypothetical protein